MLLTSIRGLNILSPFLFLLEKSIFIEDYLDFVSTYTYITLLTFFEMILVQGLTDLREPFIWTIYGKISDTKDS